MDQALSAHEGLPEPWPGSIERQTRSGLVKTFAAGRWEGSKGWDRMGSKASLKTALRFEPAEWMPLPLGHSFLFAAF